MSDEEKKKGEYEKPQSQEMGGDELEDVSGGTEKKGQEPPGGGPGLNCFSGPMPAKDACALGGMP